MSFTTRALSLLLIAALGLTMMLGGHLAFASATTAQSYNNVQIFVSPQNSSVDLFEVSAYNMTGGLVASTQTQYPAASFELPSGSYLLTVVASQPNRYRGPQPLAESTMVWPYPITPYPAEYGYSIVNLSSSTSITIHTAPISDLSTSLVTIHVTYLNGTAATNASVGASIVGGYYWTYPKNIVLSNETDTSGIATLTVPSVPVEVTAWKWLPIFLPKNDTTTPVNVGGELVNVTAYWEPTYVGLAGETIIFPPATSANITLKTQTPIFWGMSYGVATPGVSTGSGSASPASSSVALAQDPNGVPANQYSSSSSSTTSFVTTQTQTSSLTAGSTIGATQASSVNTALEIGIVLALIVAVASTIVALRKK